MWPHACNNNWACPQLHNNYGSTVQLAQSFHWAYQLSCSTDRTHQVSKKSAVTNLLFKGSQSVCSGRQGEQITPCHNSRTKLRMKLLNVEKQDNIEFYLSCKFQPSTFNVRCKTDVTDGMPDKQTNKQTNERTTVCRGSAPRHNYM